MKDDLQVFEQIALASEKIGFSSVEHAFWILIYPDGSEAKWISAAGQQYGLSSSIRIPSAVYYDPSDKEVSELLAAMRDCDWVIHVHNHPLEPYPGIHGSSTPSKQDRRFATHWKHRFPEVADRLRFFIVHGEELVEYP